MTNTDPNLLVDPYLTLTSQSRTDFKRPSPVEQNLIAGLMEEVIEKYGQYIVYIKKEVDYTSIDQVLGDYEGQEIFAEHIVLNAYLENVDGFDGGGLLFGKFGLDFDNQATFLIARNEWKEKSKMWILGKAEREEYKMLAQTGSRDETQEMRLKELGEKVYNARERPTASDLIYFPMTKSMFEVKHVTRDTPFYQLNQLPIFPCRVELWKYGGAKLETEVDAINEILEKVTEKNVEGDKGDDFALENAPQDEIGETQDGNLYDDYEQDQWS